ncbi:MAG: DUF4034 domain-containing protein [Burkholderiaceae bacterium]
MLNAHHQRLRRAVRNFARFLTVNAAIAICAFDPSHAVAGSGVFYFADAHLQDCSRPAMNAGVSNVCGASITHIEQVSWALGNGLKANQFSELEALYQRWCTGQDRFADGSWKLGSLGRAWQTTFESRARWDADLSSLRAWQSQTSNSQMALLAEMAYWRAYAWHARGQGYARSVLPEGWKLFGTRLQEAMHAAERAFENDAPKCPAVYSQIIDILIDGGAPDEVLKNFYDTHAKGFASYQQLHLSMARHFEPRWGGSVEKYAAFVDQVVELTRETEGTGMYARLYLVVDHPSRIPFEPDRADSKGPTWPRLKKSYEDLLERSPLSDWVREHFLESTCRTENHALYRRLRSEIIAKNYSVYGKHSLEVCDRMHGYLSATN